MNIPKSFLNKLQGAIGTSEASLHEPVFGGNEIRYLTECIESGYVSSVGSFVNSFENSLEQYTGAKNAIAVVNGTAGLQLALVVAGVQPGEEVVCPALSFVATANAIVHAGARPHFVDVEQHNWGMDCQKLSEHLQNVGEHSKDGFFNKFTGNRISAILPMHTLGHPADVEDIVLVAERFGLIVIEDAAESLGSFVGGRHTGLFGSIGVFSFNGNKTITTGGGGALVTDDDHLALRIRHLSTTARVPHQWEFVHDEVGYNFRMPNINAALGLAQLEQLPDLVRRQREVFFKYQSAFDDVGFGRIKSERLGTVSNYWLQAFLLDPGYEPYRDDIISLCVAAGLGVRPLWKPLNSLRTFDEAFSAKTPVSASLYERVICIPSSASLVSDG